MRIRKFVAADMRDAVAQVKRELGAEAMIIATRNVRRGLLGSGVEVTAAIDLEETETPSPAETAHRAAADGLSEADVERVILPLRAELRSLRSLLRPVAEPRFDGELRAELIALRQSLERSREPREREPLAIPTVDELAAEHDLCAHSTSQVVALVGPTGVGKTTTVAKLAAREALIRRKSVAIVTLDNYRIGGEAQIRAYADLMAVPLTVVHEPHKLSAAIARLSGHDKIYIDTAGRNPRDGRAISLLEEALGAVEGCEVHLAIGASTHADVIDDCVNRYAGVGIKRLLFTKVDEALSLEELVRSPVRHKLRCSFLTTGQRVPEDLEDASNERMLELATIGFQLQEVAA